MCLVESWIRFVLSAAKQAWQGGRLVCYASRQYMLSEPGIGLNPKCS